MTIDAGEAIAAAGGRTVNGSALPATFSFATDTRTLAPGDIFVALRGERFDGHLYAAEAIARGAAGVVVDDPSAIPEGAAGIVVADTRAAYLAFAGVARHRSEARLVAVTGSTGKTTTKTFIAQLLERLAEGRKVLATPRNENNEIGVAKFLLALPADAAFAVAELGARHYGEIEPLALAAQPEIGVLTNIGEAHLEIFGSRERLADTKWGLFAGGAAPVLNAADSVSAGRAASLERDVTWFGTSRESLREIAGPNDCTVLLLSATEGDALAVVGAARGPRGTSGLYRAEISVGGDHNRENVAAAAAAVIALGFPALDVAHALSSLALPPGRYERIALGIFDVIYDAYNASASGTIATLASFAREPADRRLAVLGSMAELGEDAPALHERVGVAAAHANLDVLLVGGDFAADIARGARGAGFDGSRIVTYAGNGGAAAWLRQHARAGDLVLLKASRKYRLEEIVEELKGTYAPS